MIVYLDTSALGRVYLGDHQDSADLAEALYRGAEPLVTSELTDVEITSALSRAERDGAIGQPDAEILLERYSADTSDSGPIGVIPLDSETLALARAYLRQTTVRTLDAIHLAACTRFTEAAGESVRLLSRDNRQNEAARALGIEIYEP